MCLCVCVCVCVRVIVLERSVLCFSFNKLDDKESLMIFLFRKPHVFEGRLCMLERASCVQG